MQQIADWLQKLGLGQYAQRFAENDEIVEVLLRLRDYSGLTMILVEQNLDFIAALSKRILIKGAITREVQPGDLGDPSLVGEFVGITT